jgi:hypothetical protein
VYLTAASPAGPIGLTTIYGTRTRIG